MAGERVRMLEKAKAEPVWPRPPLWSMALGVALAAFLLVYPFVFTTPSAHHLLILILLYALMAQSWNVVAGFSGMISLGHAMFFGIGAYSSTVLYVKYGISPWIGLLAGMVLSALAAVAVGVPTLRLRGHYFAIATLLIGAGVQIVVQRWDWVNGASGLYIPIDRTAPWLTLQFHTSKVPYYYLALGAAALGFGAVWLLRRSRLGFRLQAMRDEADAAASLGIAIARHKVLAFIISAAMMSVAGTFYAQYVLVLDPERLLSTEISIIVVLMTVLGGSGTLWGPALGAAILIPLSEYTRIWFGGTGRTVDLIIYGLLILAVCMWRPAGILSLFAERIRRGGPPNDGDGGQRSAARREGRHQALRRSRCQRRHQLLGRGLMSLPRLLMVDEPFLGLAPQVMAQMKAALGRLEAEGMAVLVIEQNVRLALSMSSRGYVLESGRLAAAGPSAELIDSPDVRRIFSAPDERLDRRRWVSDPSGSDTAARGEAVAGHLPADRRSLGGEAAGDTPWPWLPASTPSDNH